MQSILTKSENNFGDEELLIELSKADPKQFELLYNKYHEPIFRFVYQRVETKESAADITSQVFLKAMVNLKNYVSRGIPFSSWLYRIALNEVNSYYNRSKQHRVINIETTKAHELIDEMETDKTDEQLSRLYNSLTLLCDDDLHLLEMRFFESRPFKEIADILNISENNAKVKLYRVIDKLKQLIGNQHSKKNSL